MKQKDYDNLKSNLAEREQGQRFIRVSFGYSTCPSYGLWWVGEPILEGTEIPLSEEFQEELKSIFREVVAETGEDPGDISLMISYIPQHPAIKVSARVVGGDPTQYSYFYSP